MKIVFLNDVIYSYATGASSAIGGAERQQWLLARALGGAGWEVTVGIRSGLEFNQRLRIDGVEFVGLGQRNFLSTWYRFLISEHPDWWYWRCASHLFGLAVLVAKLARVRMIFAVGFDSDVNIRHALFQRPRWWPLYALGLAWTDIIFVQNDKQLFSLPKQLRAKTWKVPSITPEGESLLPHSKRAEYVAWVAMLRKFKRPDLLIEIARAAPDIRFIVCGGPTTFTAAPGYGEAIADTLRSLPNVEYRGQISADEALRVISEAALFLSTSDEEGFPNTFLQAWSAGTPVISLRIDPDQVIKRYSLGKLSMTVEQAVSDIRGLIKSPHDRQAIARRTTAYVAANHTVAAAIGGFEAATCGMVSEIPVQRHTANSI